MNQIAKALRAQVPALDGLRGIAILLVLAHGFDVIATDGTASAVADLFLNSGWIGVQLFFVLSGFLITGILLDTSGTPGYYRNFMARRILRIFPLYYGVLIVAFVVIPLLVSVPPGHGENQIWLWLYVENFTAPFGGSEALFPHFWSLCVEEQFYLLWPLLVWLGGRRGVLAIGAVLVALAVVARVWVRHRYPGDVGADAAYVFTFCRMDALAIGAMTAALLRDSRVQEWLQSRNGMRMEIVAVVALIGGCLIGKFQRTGASMQWFGYTIIALGFAGMIVAILQSSSFSSRLLAWRPLRSVGTYSYAMYVFYAPLHLLIGLPLLGRLPFSPGILVTLIYTLIMTAITYGLGALSYHLYERRFLVLKSRFSRHAGAQPS